MSAINDVLKYRQGILLASAGALLHNLGKVSSRFVGSKVPPKWTREYKYQHICGFFLEDVDKIGCHGSLTDKQKELYFKLAQYPENKNPLSDGTVEALRKNIEPLLSPFDDRKDKNGNPCPYRIGDLLEYLGQGEGLYPSNIRGIFQSSLLTHLMNKCHHGASGGDKDKIYLLQQSRPLYLATPLGHEQPAPDLTEYDRIKGEVEKVIQKHLTNPDKFSLREFIAELGPLLRRILGDTQRGVNDVTVWDIGHSGMAFLKAGIWSCAGKSLSHDDLYEGTPGNYQPKANHPRWRLWRVGLNGLDFLTGAVSVADLRVRQRLLQEYLETARQFAEDEYPVATEIYRDENGGIYVFPDWEEGKSPEYEAFARELEKALPGKAGTDLSLPELYGLRPAIELSGERYHNHPECRGSSVKYIGDAVREWVEKPLAAEPVFEAYTDSFDTDLCPYCGVRPIGGGENLLQKLPEKELPEKERRRCTAVKARQRKICCLCMCARGWVAKEWWEKENFSTIWVDEVADVNGRVALVVGKFGVEKMLKCLIYPPDKAIYPPDKVWLLQAKTVSGSVPPPGSEFECGGVGFKVLSHDPSTGDVEMVASNKIGPLREELELVAIDFSSSRLSSLGRQSLSLDLPVSSVSFDSSSNEFVLECRDNRVRDNCRSITNQSDLPWGTLQGVVCEIKAGNQNVSGRIAAPRKIRLDQSASQVVRDLLWTDGSGWYFYQSQKSGRYVKTNEYLNRDNYNNYRNKGFTLFSASSASFARFRRVWESTARFWQGAAPLKEQVEDWQKELAASLAVDALGKEGRRRRLEVVLTALGKPGEIAPFHAYELEAAGVSIGIVPIEVREKQATCVTIENLGYVAGQLGAPEKVCADPCAAAAYVQGKLWEEQGREVRIKAAQGYGSGKRDCGSARISGVRLAGQEYFPVIPVLANPRVFAVLLPASAAVELVRRIHEKYTEEMGKVRWRLPLTLGTVFFPRHLPLRVVLDAGWRLLDQTKQIPRITAKVTSVERLGTATHNNLGKHPDFGQWPAKVTVVAAVTDSAPAQHDRQVRLRWKVPTVMGDKCTFDIWYPWVKLADPNAPADRPLSFRHNDTTWLHVTELKPGDEIAFCPSTWDFVFLENAGERFTIAYGKDGRRLGLQRRPYYLEEIDRLAGHWNRLRELLSSTQRHALWQTLLERYACWEPGANDPTWKQFCRDTLLNAGWKGAERDKALSLVGRVPDDWPSLETLAGAAASGVLFDLFELYMTILKEGE